MSSYINLYLKTTSIAGGITNFIPLASYSRSSLLYQFLSEKVPYEKVRCFTEEKLSEIVDSILFEKGNYEIKEIKLENMKHFIERANNTVDEKFEALNDIDANIKECKEYIEECIDSVAKLNLLMDIISEVKYIDEGPSPCPDMLFDFERCIYIGIECGYPTEEDIVD